MFGFGVDCFKTYLMRWFTTTTYASCRLQRTAYKETYQTIFT